MTQTVLISGAGTGIGRATAQRFLNEGWHVLAVGRRPEPLEALAHLQPGQVTALPCDLNDESAVQALVTKISSLEASGSIPPLKALINNAGIYERASFLDSGDDLWMRMISANLLAPVRLTRFLIPLLVKNGGGTIVNISSTVGVRPVPHASAYAATKAAMVNWTQTLALELAPQKIRVNCVCPGIVDTPIHFFHNPQNEKTAQVRESVQSMQPLGRIGQPEEVAHSVYHFCAPGSEWTTGAVLAVDGGISL